MRAGQQARGRRNLLAGAAAAAAEWLLEPVEPPAAAGHPPAPPREEHVVVAVIALGARSGATTVARALGAELAARDERGACAVSTTQGGPPPLGTPAAGRLARALAPAIAAPVRACGRLCLVDAPDPVTLADAALRLAPLVFDVTDHAAAAGVAALADRVVLVGGPLVEPALAGAVAASLARVGPKPIVVASRPPEESAWEGRAEMELPHSRLGAQWALAGREPRGELGHAIAGLADLLGAQE